MCEAKPGARCAADTRDGATATAQTYKATHPGGPAVEPLTAAAEAMRRPSRRVDPGREYARTIEAQVPGVMVNAATNSSGIYVLHKIAVDPAHRGQGKAEQALSALTAHADREGMTMALSPDNAFGSSKARLTRWYAKHGFVPNKGRAKNFLTMEAMVRPPKENTHV